MRGAIIVAAGSASRFGKNKLAETIFDKSVVERSVDIFRNIADEIVVVGDWQIDGAKTVKGGSTRSQSVKAGLSALSEKCAVVAIHDGARPFVSKALAEKLFCEAEKFGSAIPRLPIYDTLYAQTKDGVENCNREDYFTVQTPQVFDYEKIKQAYEKTDIPHTDESSLFQKVFGSAHFVDGEFSNKKITVPSDLPFYKVGNGFDVHPFCKGDGVILGGVKIPFDKKLSGHSDADVLAHAICDAVLSASGNKDIGVQFPDTDDRFSGADSLKLLARCVELAEHNGFAVQNVSAVVICQQPKIAPHTEKMAEKLAAVLGVDKSCVNLSATTTEHLGALGNGDGIAAEAYALLVKAF